MKRSPCIDFDIGSDISARLRAFSALRTKVKIEISHLGMLRVSPRSVSTFFFTADQFDLCVESTEAFLFSIGFLFERLQNPSTDCFVIK